MSEAETLPPKMVAKRFYSMQMIESEPLTFAEHLRMMEPDILRRLKLPLWLLPMLPYSRKDQASMTSMEQERFLCALNMLVQNGTYGQLVDIHNILVQNHFQHGTLRFLPWHRIYLVLLERSLRSLHPDVALPYWDWSNSQEQGIPGWLQNVTPTIVTPTQTIHVIRAPRTSQDLASIVSNIPSVLNQTDFNTFSPSLEGVHGAVHIWVGGSMSYIPTAPADPIFWMHHANIDRLWAQWQQSPQGRGKNPVLPGTSPTNSPVMDPWQYTEPDTRDTRTLGYVYA